MPNLLNLLRVTLILVFLAASALVHGVVLLLLMPFRGLRIRSCNVYGWITGRAVLALAGLPWTVEGREHLDPARPAIYVSNHTSSADIFLGIALGPLGVCGVAKKEVVWYPFFGQLYALSGHLLIDRGNSAKAVAAMKRLEALVGRYRLSIWMWPEGTRSKDGRLLPFKKGVWHLAVGTGLPVVPVVVEGAHRAVRKGTVQFTGHPITVRVLPAIDTSDWASQDADTVIAALHAQFVAALPDAQRPVA